MKASWDYEIPNCMEKYNMFQNTNHIFDPLPQGTSLVGWAKS
jgi:hypothetical protein